MTIFTKGPWAVSEKSARDGLIVWNEDRLHIAYVTDDGDADYFISEEIKQANARLIAAAPDLLSELKTAVTIINAMRECIDAMSPDNCERGNHLSSAALDFINEQAAIAKAEGR